MLLNHFHYISYLLRLEVSFNFRTVQKYILSHAAGIAAFVQNIISSLVRKKDRIRRLIILRSWTIVSRLAEKLTFFVKPE